MKQFLGIHGMHCEHCAAAVRDVLSEAGAKKIDISLADKSAVCESELSEKQIAELLNEEGFSLVQYEIQK